MSPGDLVFLFDVDNTLLDNDRAKELLGRQLDSVLEADDSQVFWRLYEEVRAATGMVSFPLVLERFLPTHCHHPLAPQLAAEAMFSLDYEECLRPGALEAVAWANEAGTAVVLSNGDQWFQRWKIWRSGLGQAVDGRVWVFPDKEQHFADLDDRFGPTSRFVLVEDKIDTLTAAAEHWQSRVITVLMDFGHHAAERSGSLAPDLVVGSPEELVIHARRGRFRSSE